MLSGDLFALAAFSEPDAASQLRAAATRLRQNETVIAALVGAALTAAVQLAEGRVDLAALRARQVAYCAELEQDDAKVIELADEALEAAGTLIADRLGVTTGDCSAQVFSGDEVRDMLAAYVRAELRSLLYERGEG
jgi:hypothetical protein